MASILLIDDDELVRASVQGFLELAGHEVATAPDGRAGLQSFQSGSYDLVIVDIIMPEADGIETIREIRRSAPTIPIIAISGGGRTVRASYLEAAKAFGATAMVPKPFSRNTLLKQVAEALKISV